MPLLQILSYKQSTQNTRCYYVTLSDSINKVAECLFPHPLSSQLGDKMVNNTVIKIEEYILYTTKSGDKVLRVNKAMVEKKNRQSFDFIGQPERLDEQYTKVDAVRNSTVSNIAEIELGQTVEIVGTCISRTSIQTFYDDSKIAHRYINWMFQDTSGSICVTVYDDLVFEFDNLIEVCVIRTCFGFCVYFFSSIKH